MKLIAALIALFTLSSSLAAQTPQDPPIPADTEIVSLPSGLKYSVLVPGSGTQRPSKGDEVSVHYTGWLTTGVVFDSSRKKGRPWSFAQGMHKAIDGMDEAVALMTKGAKFKLTIPPELGYGATGFGNGVIPPNATLIFEVELVDFIVLPKFRAGDKAKQKKTESGLVYEPLIEGNGALAGAGDVVVYKVAAWRENGELLFCNELQNGNKPLSAPFGKLQWPIADEASKLMKVGSSYRFEASAASSLGAQIPRDTDPTMALVWEIGIVELKKPLPVPAFAMPDAAKLTKTASGLAYEVLVQGTGKKPAITDTVTAHYAGWLTNGTLFDDTYSRADAMTRAMRGVIPGWREGLQLMSEGSIYRFVIPPGLAYGKQGSGATIPPDATLVFQIELIKVGE